MNLEGDYKTLARQFVEWYSDARPGDRYTYYSGPHLHETMASVNVKNVVWDYACNGKVYIFQPRDMIDSDIFNFIAIKSQYKISRLIPYKTATDRIRKKP